MLLAPTRNLMLAAATLLAVTAAVAFPPKALADDELESPPAEAASGAARGAAPDDGGPPGPPGDPDSWSWGVGLIGIGQLQPYTGIKGYYMALPMLYFENRWVQLLGPRLDLKLPGISWGKDQEQELTFGVGAELFGFDGYEGSDAPILKGMKSRRGGIFAGPFVKWRSPLAEVKAEWMLDATRYSKGQRLSLGMERSFGVGQHLMFTPSVTFTWLDEKYTDYYYGVRAAEARPNRAAYAPQGTANATLGLRVDYMFTEHQAVFGSLELNGLGREITRSPLVDRSLEPKLLLTYLYRFR